MLDLGRSINGLRKISFFLFILPVIGLLGSLIFNNILTEFKFVVEGIVLSVFITPFQITHPAPKKIKLLVLLKENLISDLLNS